MMRSKNTLTLICGRKWSPPLNCASFIPNFADAFCVQNSGINDCCEALTNEDRPYRRARQPLETLKFLKDDVEAGKFSRDIFEKFCYSLI